MLNLRIPNFAHAIAARRRFLELSMEEFSKRMGCASETIEALEEMGALGSHSVLAEVRDCIDPFNIDLQAVAVADVDDEHTPLFRNRDTFMQIELKEKAFRILMTNHGGECWTVFRRVMSEIELGLENDRSVAASPGRRYRLTRMPEITEEFIQELVRAARRRE